MRNRLMRKHNQDTTDAQMSEIAQIETLAGKAMGGDSDALLALCEATAKSILFRTMRLLPERMDAEDAAQEALIRMCKSIGTLKDSAAFGGWLNRIIINETNRFHSKNNKRSATIISIDNYTDFAAHEESEDLLPFEYAVREEDRKAVMDAVDKLPKRQMEAIMLHYYEGMSVTETAGAMGTTSQATSRYLMLARDKIKKSLEEKEGIARFAGGIAMLPMGSLLVQVLGEQSGVGPLTDSAWMEQAMRVCAQVAGGAAGAASTAGVASAAAAVTATASKPVVAAAAIVAVTTVGVGVRYVIVPGEPPLPTNLPIIYEAEGRVLFEGGEQGYDHLNPKKAVVSTSSKYGELTAISWTISTTNDQTVLYEGEGGDADEALAFILSDGEDGEYIVEYLLEDAHGGEFSLTRTFYIAKDDDVT